MGNERTAETAWVTLVILVIVALLSLLGNFFYTGIHQGGLFSGNEIAVMFAALVMLLLALTITISKFNRRKKKVKHRKHAWRKNFEAHAKLPRPWVPPSIWKTSEEAQRKETEIALKTDFDGLDPLEFERFVMTLLRKMGYDASAAPKRGSKLGGFAVNILARKGGEVTAIETRSAHEGIVEEKDVVRLLRSRKRFGADRMLIVSASAVSDAAYGAARGRPLDIWDDSKLRKIVRIYLAK